ncbi:MAG TPA: glutathione binding-like protein [Novosphingobium sp.]|nr:glutathione binding-like protein [Novosphingobium sp.]
MIELWGASTPNVQKVLLALEELETPYEMIYVNLLNHEVTSPKFATLTHNRKVPLIVDPDGPGGEPVTVWESGAILFYLAEKFGRFFPRDGAGRYRVMQWLMFQMSGIGPMFGQHIHFTRYAPEETYSSARYTTEVKRLYDVVERRLSESPYLAGDDYTIADIATWPVIHQIEMRGVGAREIPNVVRWIEQIAKRPAVARLHKAVAEIPRPDVNELLQEQPDVMDRYFGRGRYSRA